jgi:hypothetical protein
MPYPCAIALDTCPAFLRRIDLQRVFSKGVLSYSPEQPRLKSTRFRLKAPYHTRRLYLINFKLLSKYFTRPLALAVSSVRQASIGAGLVRKQVVAPVIDREGIAASSHCLEMCGERDRFRSPHISFDVLCGNVRRVDLASEARRTQASIAFSANSLPVDPMM